MKRNTRIFIKTSALVAAFMLLLGAGIMSLSFSHSGTKPNDNNFLTPDLAITAPTSQELLQKKFNAYNTVTEENGKSVVTIFSEEQVKDIRARREKGEWFWLSSEEMLYLINDTVELFKSYDIVYIRDLDGNLNKYYGLSFFSSEEYYASFNGFDLGVTDASFDLKKDVYETIFTRAEVLNNAFYNGTSFFTDLTFEPSKKEVSTLQKLENPWSDRLNNSSGEQKFNFGFWDFFDERIFYTPNISKEDSIFATQKGALVYPLNMETYCIGEYKYDIAEKNIVIELYKEESQKLVARIRLDEQHNLEEMLKIESLFSLAINSDAETTTVKQNTDYRIAVYMNGFFQLGAPIPPILYCPDGDIDIYSFTDDHAIFETRFSLSGCTQFAEYINSLLSVYLA